MGKCSPQGKGFWQRPGAPPPQWVAGRRRALREEMTEQKLPQQVFEALATPEVQTNILAKIASASHRMQVRNELKPLLMEALAGRDPLRADAPKGCRWKCAVPMCGGPDHGATHHLLCITYKSRAQDVKEAAAAVREYLPRLAAGKAQELADAAGDAGAPSTPPVDTPAPAQQAASEEGSRVDTEQPAAGASPDSHAVMARVEEAGAFARSRAGRDTWLDNYFYPDGLGAAAAEEREATWMRRAMGGLLGGRSLSGGGVPFLTTINATPIRRYGAFHLRARPDLYDFVTHGRKIIFINLGAEEPLSILQEHGFETVPCGTEGCMGCTEVVDINVKQVNGAAMHRPLPFVQRLCCYF
jgi:hypothetical protein